MKELSGKKELGVANYQVMEFPDPGSMYLTFYPGVSFYPWQKEELLRLAGWRNIHLGERVKAEGATAEKPYYQSLVAANGSGKDAFFITPIAIWFIASKIRARCIITSSSHEQLFNQTFSYIKRYAEEINRQLGEVVFDIIKFHIKCRRTGSEIKCFVTDEPGKAEGYHPFPDYPNAEMLFIVNEAKSVEDEMFKAFNRFTGYNMWLEVSSPGAAKGKFYRTYQSAVKYPAEFKEGRTYARRVTAFDCPHIAKAHIDKLAEDFGKDSSLYRTSILAEFCEDEETLILPARLFEYIMERPATYGMPVTAGLDLAITETDEISFYVVHGSHTIGRHNFYCTSPDALHDKLIGLFSQYDLQPENISADAGGIGLLILKRLAEAGWPLNWVRNEGKPGAPKAYKNRGTELYFTIRRLMEARVIQPPMDDVKLIRQLQSRRIIPDTFPTQIEPKRIMRSRSQESPDRADAYTLAYAQAPIAQMIRAGRMSIEYGQNPAKKHFDTTDFAGLEAEISRRVSAQLSKGYSVEGNPWLNGGNNSSGSGNKNYITDYAK